MANRMGDDADNVTWPWRLEGQDAIWRVVWGLLSRQRLEIRSRLQCRSYRKSNRGGDYVPDDRDVRWP